MKENEMDKYPIYTKALEIATKAHEGQKRRDGTPYINHPIAVSRPFLDDMHKATAVLHDVIEDCGLVDGDLLSAGMPNEVVSAVKLITRWSGENYFDFIQRVACRDSTEERLADWMIMAMRVKVADLEHNMKTLEEGSMKDKYRFAHYLLTMAIDSESVPGTTY